ncbi:hypothetical protein GCM10017673_32260 [Streptosporangium violaceochromogenes]|nr:hypothetical protein GCM10017673_32260 [Streptosporangium violaceochromogenes]
MWFALYREPLTFEQERAGFRPTMLCGSAEDLQAELALRCRTTRLPLPPPTPWKLISRKTGTTPYRLSPPSPAGRPSTFPNGHPAGLQGDPHPPQGPRRGG